MKKKKIIISSILSLVLFLSFSVGVAFALFISKSKVNIAVTSGKIEVFATIDENSIETKQLYEEYKIGTDYISKDATVSIDGGNIVLDKIIPGDGVKFEINVQNKSNVAIKYRTVITNVGNGSMNGLVVTINGKEYSGNKVNSNWLLIGAGDMISNIPVSIELFDNKDNDLYQDVTTNIEVTVEAVQGNAKVENNPDAPEEVAPGTLDELKEAFAAAVDQKTGNLVITLLKDFDANNDWVAYAPSGYNGVNEIIIEGNGHTIYNLNQPLMVGAFGGAGSITINNLTLKDVNINTTSFNGMGVGAFVCYSDSSSQINLNNCHVTASPGLTSTIICQDGYAGGLLGFNSSVANINDCSVTNTIISGEKSVGGLIGHVSANVEITNSTVVNCTLNETMTSEKRVWGVGAIIGRTSGGTVVTMELVTIDNNKYNVTNLKEGSTQISEYYGANNSSITLDGNNI